MPEDFRRLRPEAKEPFTFSGVVPAAFEICSRFRSSLQRADGGSLLHEVPADQDVTLFPARVSVVGHEDRSEGHGSGRLVSAAIRNSLFTAGRGPPA